MALTGEITQHIKLDLLIDLIIGETNVGRPS